MFICIQLPHQTFGNTDKGGCFDNALEWISEIDSKDITILKKYAANTCLSTMDWIKIYGDQGVNRDRFCTDLVLIRTHKECIYYRDYIIHTAYNPCKSWSREMFEQCIGHNDKWFAN